MKDHKALIAVIGVAIISVGVVIFSPKCNDAGPSPPIQVYAAWEPDGSPDIIYYSIGVWQGNDTLDWLPTLMTPLDTVQYIDTLSTYKSKLYDFTYDWLIVSGQSVDIYGDKSLTVFSRFYQYYEFAPPAPPVNLEVEVHK